MYQYWVPVPLYPVRDRVLLEVPSTLPKYPVFCTVQSGTGTPKESKYPDFGYFQDFGTPKKEKYPDFVGTSGVLPAHKSPLANIKIQFFLKF